MSAEIDTVSVHILDRDYQVACPPGQQEALVESAKHLDQQMRGIRQAGKVIGLERIAVMAALNITYELLQQGHQSDKGEQDVQERLRRLTARLDDTINHYRQIEL